MWTARSALAGLTLAGLTLLTLGTPASAQAILNEQAQFEPRQDTYTFTAEPGQTVIIEMVSDVFDTFLTLLTPNGEVLEQNDDYNDLLNATIVVELEEGGEYTVLAGSHDGQFAGGEYRLSVKAATDYQRVYDRAIDFMQSEDYSDAAEAYAAAIVLEPSDPKSYLGRADATLRHHAFSLGDKFTGPESLPQEVRDAVVMDYERASELFAGDGEVEFANLILEQAEFIRTGQPPG